MKTFSIYFSGVIAIQDVIQAETKLEAITKFLVKWGIDFWCFYLECEEV